MAFTKEYASKLVLNLDQVRQISRAQRNIYDSGIVSPNSNTLASALSGLTSVLGLAFMIPAAGALSIAVVGIVSGMVPSEKSILKEIVYDGYWNLGYIEDFLVDNPDYDMLEVNLPFIEYEDAGVRFITGRGAVTRVHTHGGWILM